MPIAHDLVTPLLPGGAHHKLGEIGGLESDEALHQRMSQDITQPSGSAGSPLLGGHSLCMAPNGEVSVCIISHGQTSIVGNSFDEAVEMAIVINPKGMSFPNTWWPPILRGRLSRIDVYP